MARDALGQGAVGVLGEGERAQGHALVEAAAVADDAGLADDHARAVVDEEIVADGGPGMDVDARARVGHLGDDARDQRHLEAVELVGDAVMHHGVHGGIAEDGLARAGGRGVAFVARLGIPGQLVADVRQLVHEGQRQLAAVALAVLAALALARAGEGDAALDLLGQQPVDAVQVGGQMMAHGFAPDARGPEIAGEQRCPQAIHDLAQPVQGRHGHAAGRTVPDLVQGFGMAKTVDHGIQALHGVGRRSVLKNAHNHLRHVFSRIVHGRGPQGKGKRAPAGGSARH